MAIKQIDTKELDKNIHKNDEDFTFIGAVVGLCTAVLDISDKLNEVIEELNRLSNINRGKE